MGPIQHLADELGAEERTLRRAVAQGTVRGNRSRPRRLRLADDEVEYLRDHWQLLSQLRQALRTERNVRLAVIYGSLARGDGDADSDLDLAVSIADDRPLATTELAVRLERAVGRRVDIPRLETVETEAPLLLDRILEDGRVIVDRDDLWPRLQDRRRPIRARADRAYRRQMAEAGHVISELTR
jgi:predicted nucleotidyltransferase